MADNIIDLATAEELAAIAAKVPLEASSSNKLADKAWVSAAIDTLKNGRFVTVEELPDEGEVMTIYLVPREDEESGNVYDEYIWTDDDWEKIGSTDIDLSEYYTKTAANAKFVEKITGRGLSQENYTTAEKTKLEGVETGAKDNVVEAASSSAFPQSGTTGKIYVAKDTNKTYRWNGSAYTEVGGGSGGGGGGAVTSVNNKTGAVTLTASDVGAVPTTGGTMTGQLTVPMLNVGQFYQAIATIEELEGVNVVICGIWNFGNFVGSRITRLGGMQTEIVAFLSDIPSVAGLAPLVSPAFTGTPTAPTPTADDNSTKVATTAFVANAIAGATPNLDYVMRVDPETGGIYYTTPDETPAAE